jgi:hypothetical protein
MAYVLTNIRKWDNALHAEGGTWPGSGNVEAVTRDKYSDQIYLSVSGGTDNVRLNRLGGAWKVNDADI